MPSYAIVQILLHLSPVNATVVYRAPSLGNNNRDIFLLTSSDREQSDGDSEADLFLLERERLSSSPEIRECEDGMRESLTQAFSHNEPIYNIDNPPALVIRKGILYVIFVIRLTFILLIDLISQRC